MQNLYSAYIKTIDGVTFYFVKHYQTFPEYSNVAPVLQTYGMHKDFFKACKIARIEDELVQNNLLETVKLTPANAEIIHMNHEKASIYNYKFWRKNLPLVNWVGIRKLLHFRQRIA